MTFALHYVPRTMRQHGAHSGYDILFRYMSLQPACSRFGTWLADAIPRSMAWRLWQLRPQETAAAGLRAELGALPTLALGRRKLCHFIYGEDTFFFTPLWQRGGNRSIATFHYPPQRLALRVNAGSLKSLHAALMVGENQREFLQQLLPAERVHYCPHPVDADFFCPRPESPLVDADADGTSRLLCSGATLRDMATLCQVFRALRAAHPGLQLDIVGANDEQVALMQSQPGVTIHRNVSDEGLRDLYRRADVGVLPLYDATANNALLELMACGRPVVATRVGGLPAYAERSAVHLTPPGDLDGMADAVLRLLRDPELRTREGTANRAHAVSHFSLPRVAERMGQIYAECADDSRPRQH